MHLWQNQKWRWRGEVAERELGLKRWRRKEEAGNPIPDCATTLTTAS
jgi:hypothetical protein